jgi:hypothetical protein
MILMGEARRRKLEERAQGVVDDGYRVRVREPAKLRKRRERAERKGVLLPVAPSVRRKRRSGQLPFDAKGPQPLTADVVEQIHGPIRLHNAKARSGEIEKNEPLEIESTEETDDAPSPAL